MVLNCSIPSIVRMLLRTGGITMMYIPLAMSVCASMRAYVHACMCVCV